MLRSNKKQRTFVVIVVGWCAVTALRGAPLHPVAGVVLEDRVLAPIPPEPGVEVEYPGRVLAVDGAQALELDHELGHHDGAVPLAHPRELRHVLPVRGARRADDGDGRARGEAAGEEDDPAPRALGDRGGALGGVGGAGGGGGEQRPGVPREGGGVLPGGEAERPGVVGHAVERGAVAGREVGEGHTVVAVPEGADRERGRGGGGGGGSGPGRGQVVGGGRRREGGGGGRIVREVGGGQVQHAAELEGDEEEVGRRQRQHQVRRPHPPRHCLPPPPSGAGAEAAAVPAPPATAIREKGSRRGRVDAWAGSSPGAWGWVGGRGDRRWKWWWPYRYRRGHAGTGRRRERGMEGEWETDRRRAGCSRSSRPGLPRVRGNRSAVWAAAARQPIGCSPGLLASCYKRIIKKHNRQHLVKITSLTQFSKSIYMVLLI
jgi:hypothetical protein